MPGRSPRERSSRTKTFCTLRTASSREETGLTLAGPAIPLAPIRQASGKLVHVWAIEADIDPSTIRSNSFPLEWPPRSGQVRQFPEVDRAAWFDLAEARSKIHKGQIALLDEMKSKLGG